MLWEIMRPTCNDMNYTDKCMLPADTRKKQNKMDLFNLQIWVSEIYWILTRWRIIEPEKCFRTIAKRDRCLHWDRHVI